MISETPPARSRSTSVSSEAGNTTAEDEQTIRDDYAHPTSLKAWKQKRDKEIQEEELAKAKRAESANKRGKTKTPRGSEKPGKEASPHEKSSKDSKLKQQTSTASIDKPPVCIDFQIQSKQSSTCSCFQRKLNHHHRSRKNLLNA